MALSPAASKTAPKQWAAACLALISFSVLPGELSIPVSSLIDSKSSFRSPFSNMPENARPKLLRITLVGAGEFKLMTWNNSFLMYI
jgi:hypothetical protein